MLNEVISASQRVLKCPLFQIIKNLLVFLQLADNKEVGGNKLHASWN